MSEITPPSSPESDAAIDKAARRLLAAAEEAVSEHPSIEEIVDYQEGRLAGADAERLREHLVACPQCAQEVLELADFEGEAEESEPDLTPSRERTQREWRRFEARRDLPPVPVASSRRSARWSQFALLAASLVVAAGVGFWLGQPDPGGDVTPSWFASPTPFAFTLEPEGEGTTRGGAPVAPVEVPAGMNTLSPTLTLGDVATPYRDFRAEAADADENIVWSQSSLPRQPNGSFVLFIPCDRLPSGRYRLRLYGTPEDRGQEVLLGTYPFHLSDATTE